MQGLRKLAYLGMPYADLVKKVKYTFGLYCGAPMVGKEDFLSYIADLNGISPQDIANVNFKRVSKEFDVEFDVSLNSGEKKVKKLNIMHLLELIGHYPPLEPVQILYGLCCRICGCLIWRGTRHL